MRYLLLLPFLLSACAPYSPGDQLENPNTGEIITVGLYESCDIVYNAIMEVEKVVQSQNREIIVRDSTSNHNCISYSFNALDSETIMKQYTYIIPEHELSEWVKY